MKKYIAKLFTVVAAAVTLASCTSRKSSDADHSISADTTKTETKVRLDSAYLDLSDQAKGFVTIHEMDGSTSTYDLKSIARFFNENNKKFKAKYVADTYVEGKKISVDGKPVSSLPAEAVANLVLKDGIIMVGNNPASSSHFMTSSDPDKSGEEPGKIGHIHTHPAAGDMSVQVDHGFVTTMVNIHGGMPSPGDNKEYDRIGKGHRFIVVDQKNVYFYNGNASQTLQMPRPKR